jgi:signal transduction histidine kinase
MATAPPRAAYPPNWMSAPVPANEADRLRAIERYQLGGIGRDPAFDRVTRLATDLFDMPISLVSIVGSDMQCFRGGCGMDAAGTPREQAFCAFAILGTAVMVVPDTALDPHFVNHPLVLGEPHIRFYAGAPLRIGGLSLGTLCLIDTRPRMFDSAARRQLAALAESVVDMIELRVDRFAAEAHRQRTAAERELLTLTVENVSEGVALFDGDLRLTVWNEAFARLFDYAPGQIAEGVSAAELMGITARRGELGPGDPDAIVAAFVASIHASEARDLEVRRANCILDIRRRTISGGRFILTARDVTQDRQIARLKDELVSTVSHELRTPLTAISGALGLMASGAAGELPDRAARLVKVGYRNAERLASLVNDLLDMDKLQSGKVEFHFADGDLRALLADAVEQNQSFAERFGVTLDLALPDQPVPARFDAMRLHQVVTNLLSNAAKFSPEGERVQVTLTVTGDGARISVADRGPGVSPAFRARLFDRFAQEEGAHQQKHAGTGLGLAISQAIAQAHGGEIALDPADGPGATFHVMLPLAGAEGAGT